MRESDEQGLLHRNPTSKSSIISCLVSLISVFFTQFTLFLLPFFLQKASFFTLLPLSALLLVAVVGVGGFCKRIAGVRASPPSFVFCSILFTWSVYLYAVRQVVSSLVDIAFNLEIIMVIIGLCRIMSLDPGFVTRQDEFFESPLSKVEAQTEELIISTSIVQHESPAEEVRTRAKYCKHCKKYVMGFDHHCPAFGNCIGQRNHLLFTVLLVGFVLCESTFVACASQFTAKSQTTINEVGRQATIFRNLVFGTMLFCVIQVLWQVVFLMWHVYCACFNIKTDEWINWKRYPEFQMKVGQNVIQFVNPYDKGVMRNLNEFVMANG